MAIIFYFRSAKEKLPIYALKSFNLISNELSSIGDLGVKFKGNNIENLSISKLFFWNGGRETIDKNDFVELDRLRVEFKKGIMFYKATKILENNPSSNFQLKEDYNKNIIYLEFDYLDKSEGVVIDIYHSGKDSEDIILNGKFKGAKECQTWRL